MTLILIIASVLAYALVGAWIFGYVAGLDGQGEACDNPKYKGLYWYRNEECAWVPAIFWPIALVYYLTVRPLARLGYRQGSKSLKVRKIRIELEKKIRVEQEKIENEVEEEIEEALRKEAAA